MGMPSSGNPISANDFNGAFKRTLTAEIEWNDAELRRRAAKTTAGSAIAASDLYDKYTGTIKVTSALIPDTGGATGWIGAYGSGGVDPQFGNRPCIECFYAPPYTAIGITVTGTPDQWGVIAIRDANFNLIFSTTSVTWTNLGSGKWQATCLTGTNWFPVGSVRYVGPSA